MKKNLVIVESPAKAKTIEKYLGRDYKVMASVGHIRDLPSKKLGVDVKKNFKPTYETIKGKDKVIKDIKDAGKKAEKIFLAPDPDREGEAIAWHISEELKGEKKKIKRILFNEITKNAVQEAMKHPLDIDKNKFESQQARRILDRLVGYQISPILWDKVRRGLSAGRVQSVALKLVVDREKEIAAFIKEEYWSVQAQLESKGEKFWAKLAKKDGKKIEIPNKTESDKIVAELKGAQYKITNLEKSERRRNPLPPFITSKLQQEASRKLRYPAKKTMMIAQKLYEGIDLGELGTQGLITYMRTDSTRISDNALKDVRSHIKDTYGAKYMPAEPNLYKSKKSAQDAHEAIRPTNLDCNPKAVKEFLSAEQYKLYVLIWNRFVASQMVPAVFDQTTVEIQAGKYELRATGSVMKFDGFTAVYEETKDEDAVPDEDDSKDLLPPLDPKAPLKLVELKPEQHFTQPPPRYTDASLIKDLEEKGIGRPSTYAAIISTLVEKKYTEKDQAQRFHPSELGKIVTELLQENFEQIMDVEFTAQMEDQLDKIEEGEKGWVQILDSFYGPFKKTLDVAKEKMRNVKAQAIPTDIKCTKCSDGMMQIKWGRNGQFLACSNYPDCKGTSEFERDTEGKIVLKKEETVDEKCEKCGKPMTIKFGRFGKFLACTGYPECKSTKPISTGIKCPKCESGKVTARKSKRGKAFYGCTNYPKCDFVSWDKPVAKVCPQCKSPYLLEKYSKKDGKSILCPNKDCGYREEVADPAESEAG